MEDVEVMAEAMKEVKDVRIAIAGNIRRTNAEPYIVRRHLNDIRRKTAKVLRSRDMLSHLDTRLLSLRAGGVMDARRPPEIGDVMLDAWRSRWPDKSMNYCCRHRGEHLEKSLGGLTDTGRPVLE